jgi:hypothetical protein
MQSLLILIVASNSWAGLFSQIQIDFEGYFNNRPKICVLCDCDGVLTQSPAREALNWENLSKEMMYQIPMFLKKHVLPSEKILTFCSAFHDQNNDETSLQNTGYLVSQVFQILDLDPPAFGPVHRLSLEDCEGFFSFSQRYPSVHLLSIKKKSSLYFTKKKKALAFHKIFFEMHPEKLPYCPEEYIFIDDNKAYFPKNLSLPFFCYNQQGDRDFSTIEKILALSSSQSRRPNCFFQDFFDNLDKSFFSADGLIFTVLRYGLSYMNMNAKSLIFPGKSPQYLRYCLEEMKKESFNSFFKQFFPEEYPQLEKVIAYLKKTDLIAVPFSGVPQSADQTMGCFLRYRRSIGSVGLDHYLLEKNLYTKKGEDAIRSFLSTTLSKIEPHSTVVVIDNISSGGGMGMFLHFFNEITKNKNLNVYCSALHPHLSLNKEKIFSYDEPSNLITFDLQRIQTHLLPIVSQKGPCIHFPSPFDEEEFAFFSDVSSFIPAEWEYGYTFAHPQECIHYLKKLLPLLILKSDAGVLRDTHNLLENMELLGAKIKNFFEKENEEITDLISSDVFPNFHVYQEFKDSIQKIIDYSKVHFQLSLYTDFFNLKKDLQQDFSLEKFHKINTVYEKFLDVKNQVATDTEELYSDFQESYRIFNDCISMIVFMELDTQEENADYWTFPSFSQDMEIENQENKLLFVPAPLSYLRFLNQPLKESKLLLAQIKNHYQKYHEKLISALITKDEETMSEKRQEEIETVLYYQSNENVGFQSLQPYW